MGLWEPEKSGLCYKWYAIHIFPLCIVVLRGFTGLLEHSRIFQRAGGSYWSFGVVICLQ
jgi:hypothetical protein